MDSVLNKISIIIVVALMFLTATNQGGLAANIYWDGGDADIGGNGNGISEGTSGTWNTTIKNWDAGGIPYVAWGAGSANVANFAGTGGVVTVVENVDTLKVNFSPGYKVVLTNSYIIIRSSVYITNEITLGGTGGFWAKGSTANLYGSITGIGNLKVAGDYSGGDGGTGNILLLSSNSFSGVTSLGPDGRLTLGHTHALCMATLNPNGTRSVISLTSYNLAYVIGGLTGSQAVNLGTGLGGGGSGFVSFGNNNVSNTYSGSLSGSAGFNKIGDGVQVFTGINAYTGPTKVSSGTLCLASTNSIPNSQLILTGGVLRLGTNNAVNSGNAITMNGGTLDPDVYTNDIGPLTLITNSIINLNANSYLNFANSSSKAWSNATLNITGDFLPKHVRFGTDSTGLQQYQLDMIKLGRDGFKLDEEGYLAIRPFGVVIYIR